MQNDKLPESILRTSENVAIPLEGVGIRGVLRHLTAEITVEQHYTNRRATNIEAVYTFPLPIGAVLLGLELDIGGRRLAGIVVERTLAERRYEETVSGGDTAVMLEQSGAGLYTMNVGNLMAGESAVIHYRYALVLSWQGDCLRLVLPTTLAPRYGDPLHSGLLPHQVPETSLAAEYPFELEFLIEAELASKYISSPTHVIEISRSDAGVRLALAQGATLDRDLVLLLGGCAENTGQITRSANAAGERAALISLRLPRLIEHEALPLDLKVVIDCSGSMAGISIEQARKAALAILDLLRPEDRFNVTLFGNQHQHFWHDLVPVEPRTLDLARRKLEQMDADMGGTETAAALHAVYRMGQDNSRTQIIRRKIRKVFAPNVGAGATADKVEHPVPPKILLITDGQVWEYEELVAEAKAANQQVFTVGVGLAVAEGLVGEIARQTGGAFELVTPQEGMTERVLAQFHRLRQPQVRVETLRFDHAPAWRTPLPDLVYAGDTLHVYAGFGHDAASCVSLTASVAGGQTLTAETTLTPTDWVDLPRMAAAARIAGSEVESDQRRWALEHQLLTRHTNLLVVAERADKAEELPELATVPHMLPAGWGGTGIDKYDIPAFSRVQGRSGPSVEVSECCNSIAESFTDCCNLSPSQPDGPRDFVVQLNAALFGSRKTQDLPTRIFELVDFGLPEDVSSGLRELLAEIGAEERLVVLAFLMALLDSPVLKDEFDRGLIRLILGGWQKANADATLLPRLQACILGLRSDTWVWRLTSAHQTNAGVVA
jgi:Ca-activated chloride channel family protein